MTVCVDQGVTYRDIINSMSDAQLVLDRDLIVQYANPAYYDTFGGTDATTLGYDAFAGRNTVLSGDIELHTLLNAVARHGVRVDDYRFEQISPSSGRRMVTVAARRIKHDGVNTEWTLVCLSDLTEATRQEEQTAQNGARKDARLVEVNHRVKNDLSSILAMLRLERRLVAGTPLDDTLQRISLRVEAIASLYELLAVNSDTETISLRDYFKRGCQSIQNVAGTADGAWSIGVTGENVDLSVDDAFNIGAIVNELVANAAKYAFNDKKDPGRILVDLKLDGANLVVTVSDDGCGRLAPASAPKPTDLGMKFMEVYLRAMDGTLEYTSARGGGTVCTLCVPLPASVVRDDAGADDAPLVPVQAAKDDPRRAAAQGQGAQVVSLPGRH